MTKKDKEVTRHYRLCHQIVSLTGINSQTKSIIGYVELTLIPSRDNLKHIRLNAKQLRIYRVSLNESVEAPFQYFDPTLEICQGQGDQTPAQKEKKDLDTFSENHLHGCNLVDPDLNAGEINIKVPAEANNLGLIAEGKPLKVSVEFSLEDPQGGVHFVVPEGEGSLAEKAAHLFTYGHENCARLWFPCLDTTSEPCTWKLEFTVEEGMTAVSCGELVDTVYTPDQKRKTFHYHVNTPTAAPNIALAVGPFNIYVDPNMHEVTHFCLPHLLPVLKSTVRQLFEVFEYYETILATPFPFTCYKQVFVDELHCEATNYSTLAIFNTSLLHPTAVIDQTYHTRQVLAHALATQFFGCFISTEKWSDRWIKKGIPMYLMGLWVKKTYGTNEYRDLIHTNMFRVVEYEEKYGGIILDCSQRPAAIISMRGETSRNPEVEKNPFCFPVENLQTCSPEYLDVMILKAHLVVRMLEHRLGQQQLLQVLNKLLSLANNARVIKNDPKAWSNMIWNTVTFTKSIFTVTGKDMLVFMDQWVRMGGHAKFHLTFIFNRKRNTVELVINQDAANQHQRGVRKYVGPVKVALQELDGQFPHTFQVEHVHSKHDITCHSKSRRNKKKKIPLVNNEEVDMDLSAMDDSPVLWIRLDPDFTLIRSVDIQQPDFQWQYQLRHERDVTAQTEAVYALERFPTPATRGALTHIIENEQAFYKVRCKATHCLTKVANSMSASWDGPPAMLVIFKRMFGSFAANNIIKQNDFGNLQNYFLQCAIPVAMAGLRNSHGICPPEVLTFLLDLFKYNDNSKNTFSDNYYRASLVKALGETVTPVVSMLQGDGVISSENLSEDTRKVVEEVTRYLNLEKLLPSYRYTVTSACLHAIRKLQKTGHLPPNPHLFRDYAAYGIFEDTRVAALECLVDYIRLEGRSEDIGFVLDLVERDKVPFIRHTAARLLVSNPPFERGRNHRNDSPKLVERLWGLMNSYFWYDSTLRCDIVDIYYTLYGRRRPQSIPNPELAALGRGSAQAWGGKREQGAKSFVIPRGEKRERDSEPGIIPPVKIKEEPRDHIVDVAGMGPVKIKQEFDERAPQMGGSGIGGMEVPDFFQDESANMGDQFQFQQSKKLKKEKKKKKDKKHKTEKKDRDLPGGGGSGEGSISYPSFADGFGIHGSSTKGMSSGSSSGSAPGSPGDPGDALLF